MTKEVASWGKDNQALFSEASGARSALVDYLRQPEFKRLLTQVSSLHEKRRFRTLAVLSEFTGEGKSFCTAALALGFAKLLRKRVLILDASFQPSDKALFAETVYGEDGGPEVSTGSIQFLSTRSNDNGHTDISDFQMGNYLASLRNQYDLILLDTCAMADVQPMNMDPVVIARNADECVLVTSQRSMDRDLLERISSDLKRWEIRLLGAIFNSGATA